MLFFCATHSCSLNSDKEQNQPETIQNSLSEKELPPLTDTSRIIIFKDHYIISIAGHSKRANTELQLVNILKEYKLSDTLYLTIKDAPSRQIENVLSKLHELKIKNYKVEVSDDYFKLPY
jgi:hypothetical protein